MGEKKTATEEIVDVVVKPSGAVSVDLGRFLRSGAGQKQLEDVRALRDFARLRAYKAVGGKRKAKPEPV